MATLAVCIYMRCYNYILLCQSVAPQIRDTCAHLNNKQTTAAAIKQTQRQGRHTLWPSFITPLNWRGACLTTRPALSLSAIPILIRWTENILAPQCIISLYIGIVDILDLRRPQPPTVPKRRESISLYQEVILTTGAPSITWRLSVKPNDHNSPSHIRSLYAIPIY